MLTGENGILTQAQRAKNETENAAKNEVAILDEYNNTLNSWTNEGTTSIPEGLEIGLTVSYNPNGTYDKFNENYSGSNNNPEQLDSSTDEYNIDTWKVFDINRKTGEITLVPETATAGKVELYGAQGYNNAVYLLNEACSNLYGDSSRGIIARSINIEDIEEKMTDTALSQAHSFISSDSNVKYGNKVSNEYTDNRYYPSIYQQENKSLVDDREENSGLKMSQQSTLIELSNEGYMQATKYIRPYQTYWYGDNNFLQTAFEKTSNGINYYNLLIPEDNSTSYWLASRCINTKADYCHFYVSVVYIGEVRGNYMTYSGGHDDDGNSYGLFPIVYLSSEYISGNITDGFIVE